MNINEVIAAKGCVGFNLEKRDQFLSSAQELIFNEKYDPGKMNLGDVGVAYHTVYFLGEYAYMDNMYYLFFDPRTGLGEIRARDKNDVPVEVQSYMFGDFMKEKMKELNTMVSGGAI